MSALAEKVRDTSTLLFVPGDRPERFTKAAASGAGLVVLDLEDAVAADRKAEARVHVAEWVAGNHECAVRINPPGTEWHEADLAAFAQQRCAVMLPKAEDAETVRGVADALGTSPLIALIETAQGVLDARHIGRVAAVQRLAFGSFDLAAQLGVAPGDREALAAARSALVLASAAVGLPGPVDGVTGDLHDDELLVDDVRHARLLGFTGKLCVHPKQVATTTAALRPTDDEQRWAREVVDAAAQGGVVAVRGQMIDKPVVDRARRVLRQAEEGNPR
ncbi:CoA ester lyase [Saccharopolyspora sp. WRP15-2]|uniref:CoA ester lyase n=1 Tax=Saccharopolyspora oryzae TaxID=2997343 RepID=A0ABT4US29_9PSEU|nr:CoA ester lyase [Saccharopolyspora oryzae]MDA3624061.1 CoA ester lyase [Saccharopolyspora oryzae]